MLLAAAQYARMPDASSSIPLMSLMPSDLGPDAVPLTAKFTTSDAARYSLLGNLYLKADTLH